jgi:hypothetical protein
MIPMNEQVEDVLLYIMSKNFSWGELHLLRAKIKKEMKGKARPPIGKRHKNPKNHKSYPNKSNVERPCSVSEIRKKLIGFFAFCLLLFFEIDRVRKDGLK